MGSPMSCSNEATGSSVSIRKTSKPLVRLETAMKVPLLDRLALALCETVLVGELIPK